MPSFKTLFATAIVFAALSFPAAVAQDTIVDRQDQAAGKVPSIPSGLNQG